MVHLIETVNGIVKQVITFLDSPGYSALEAAENLAKNLCIANGIEFEGMISCDGSVNNYSIQIIEVSV